jgi:hypothetical protein
MPLPVIADCARVVLDWTSNMAVSPTAHNVMHVDAPGKTTVDIKNSFVANLTNAMFATVFDGGELLQLSITLLDGSPDADVFDITAAAIAGTGGAQGIPQSCALMKLGTGGGGRSGRGRLFLPWLAEDQQNNGQVAGGAAVSAAWIAFANDLIADGMTIAVASYTHATMRDVITINMEDVAATQRRRNHRP